MAVRLPTQKLRLFLLFERSRIQQAATADRSGTAQHDAGQKGPQAEDHARKLNKSEKRSMPLHSVRSAEGADGGDAEASGAPAKGLPSNAAAFETNGSRATLTGK